MQLQSAADSHPPQPPCCPHEPPPNPRTKSWLKWPQSSSHCPPQHSMVAKKTTWMTPTCRGIWTMSTQLAPQWLRSLLNSTILRQLRCFYAWARSHQTRPTVAWIIWLPKRPNWSRRYGRSKTRIRVRWACALSAAIHRWAPQVPWRTFVSLVRLRTLPTWFRKW